ncbi:uncharacterized protein LOC142573227 isoform X2 [Dermacentor variabilis]|uniref:uncharacterized protein LOC142573227 isoform X2 n=1 Tax=Dermacentor variabilis TaxID=34621 RepID=UPI003F5C5795
MVHGRDRRKAAGVRKMEGRKERHRSLEMWPIDSPGRAHTGLSAVDTYWNLRESAEQATRGAASFGQPSLTAASTQHRSLLIQPSGQNSGPCLVAGCRESGQRAPNPCRTTVNNNWVGGRSPGTNDR